MAAAFAALGASAPTTARAELPVIDATAILRAEDEITALGNQLTAQQNMLKAIGSNSASALPGINSQLTSILTAAQGVGYSASDVQSLLNSVYPDAATIGGLSPGDLTNALQAWHNATGQSLRTALQTQQTIAQQQPAMQSAVTGALGASQGAVGQTGAIQATNQLLATVSAQLTQLQAILTTQARAAELAQQQQLSDAAVAESAAERVGQAVEGGPPGPAPGVTDTSSL